MAMFFIIGADKKIKGNKIVNLNSLIDWSRIRKHLIRIHSDDIDPQGGQKPYDHVKIFKMVLLKKFG